MNIDIKNYNCASIKLIDFLQKIKTRFEKYSWFKSKFFSISIASQDTFLKPLQCSYKFYIL